MTPVLRILRARKPYKSRPVVKNGDIKSGSFLKPQRLAEEMVETAGCTHGQAT